MKTPTALSVTSSQREQTSLRSQVPRSPRSNVCSTRDVENPSASVHRKRFSTPSLTLKFLCAGKLNPRYLPLCLAHFVLHSPENSTTPRDSGGPWRELLGVKSWPDYPVSSGDSAPTRSSHMRLITRTRLPSHRCRRRGSARPRAWPAIRQG